MFLNKNFILANELVQKLGINIANISMLRNQFIQNGNTYDIQKLNNCTFINKKSKHLPNNIKKAVKEHSFTPMNDKLPVSYVRSELPCTERELFKSGIVVDKIVVAGKKFYVFDELVVYFVGGSIPYILTKEEHDKCKEEGSIRGSIIINKNKFFVWH